MKDNEITLQEAREQLVLLFVAKEEFLADHKVDVEDVLIRLPDDVDNKKLTALKQLAAKEAKGQLDKLKGASEAVVELLEELG